MVVPTALHNPQSQIAGPGSQVLRLGLIPLSTVPCVLAPPSICSGAHETSESFANDTAPRKRSRRSHRMTTIHNRASRLALLPDLLAQRILLIDGAMGTMLQTYRLGEAEYRGMRFADWPSDRP